MHGRLQGLAYQTAHNLSTMEVHVLNARQKSSEKGLQEIMEVHGAMPSAVINLMADEVVRAAAETAFLSVLPYIVIHIY